MLWLIAFFVALLSIAFCANAALLFHERGKAQRHAAAIERFAQWPCPNCGERVGRDATIVEYGDGVEAVVALEGEPLIPAVVICCAGCRHLNMFDASGRAGYGRGVFFNPEAELREEECWHRLAAALHCPKCDHRYTGWSGRVSAASGWPLGKSAPIMSCPNCGADAMAIELASGAEAGGVLFEDRCWKLV